jgi:hypothetical protein
MNELLAQAAVAAEALAAETARARDRLAELSRGTGALTSAVEQGVRDAEDRLDQAVGRLAEAEQELSRDSAAALARVHGVAGGARRVQQAAAALLARVAEELRELREDKERALAALDTDGDAARAGLSRYVEGLRGLEGEAALHLERQQQQLAAVRAEALALRQQAGARVESLVDGLRAVEDAARGGLANVAASYAAFGSALQAQGEAVQDALQAWTQEAASGLDQRLGHDAVEAAQAEAGPLADALDAVERAAGLTRARHARGFEEVGRRLADGTRDLQAVKADLDVARQQLR